MRIALILLAFCGAAVGIIAVATTLSTPPKPTFCAATLPLDEFSRCMEHLLDTDTNGDGKIG